MIYNVLTYLERAARHSPQKAAVADEHRALTYEQLQGHAQQIGANLNARLKRSNRPIFVCIDRNVESIEAFLGVVYSGNFYVPVDLSLPESRIRGMLSAVPPIAIINPLDKAFPVCADGIPVFTLDELLMQTHPVSALHSLRENAKDTDPLYCIFTSGSTGVPKGVVVCHRSVIDMAEQFVSAFAFGQETVFGNQAPFDFDVSVKDVYLSLKTGGRMEILEKKLFSFPKLLIERMNERRVNTVIWAVPALNIISALRAFRTMKPEHLQNVLFSGEALPGKTLEYWQSNLPDVRYVNLYGPTEITCNCTYKIINGPYESGMPIPIGRAFPNCTVLLLDGNELITEAGRIGEICVLGSCLALGYYNCPELSEQVFVQNPLQNQWHERMYRTGDLGSLLPDGDLLFVGRRDTQIKHMGHRIELSEIELAANALAGVEVSACIYDQARTRIVLFCKCAGADKAGILEGLKQKLPKYMLPTAVVCVDSFPLTRTGKIDRKSLLALEETERDEKNGRTV